MSAHLGDAISALLDGELGPHEAGAARAHLAGCAACRAEHAAVDQARTWVRGLPPVEPRAGFVDRVLAFPPDEAGAAVAVPTGRGRSHRRSRRRALMVPRRRRAGVAAMVACAAATAGILGLTTPRDPSNPPPVGRFIEAHATAVSGADPVSRLAPVVVPVSFRR